MTILSFLSLDNQEITEQGRSISVSTEQSGGAIELDSGTSRRYIKTNKRSFTIKWEWMPSIDAHAVDNRKSRNYLKNLVLTTRNKILMSIKLDHNQNAENIYIYIKDYSENLVRRAVQDGCDYYSVTLTVEEA